MKIHPIVKLLAPAAVAVAALLACERVSAQTTELFAGWAVNPLPASGGSTPVPPTFLDPNLTIGSLNKGPGVLAVGTTGVYGGMGWTNTEANATNNGDYIAYSVSPTPGYTISFTTNILYYHNSATGPFQGELQYSTDGVNFSDILHLTYAVSNNAATTSITNNLSGIAQLQNISSGTTSYFRILNFGASGSLGTWYVNNASPVTMPDLQIIGTVTSTGVGPSDPVITPANLVVNAGTTGTLTVSALGDPATDYWYVITNSMTNLFTIGSSGGSSTNVNETITVPTANGGDTLSYYVVVSNALGMATSGIATVTVTDPYFVTEPDNAEGLYHGAVSFAASAAGTGLSYQWYFSDLHTNLMGVVPNGPQGDSSYVIGAGSDVLTITNLQPTDLTNYVLVVTGTYGSITSSVASVLSVSGQTVLAFWNFNGTPFTSAVPDPNFDSPPPYLGDGTATAVGSTFSLTVGTPFAGSVDPEDGSPIPNSNPPLGVNLPNQSWGTSDYPSSGGNKANGVRFNVSTVGARNITVTYDSRVSATASDFERLQYTTDGSTWTDYHSSTTFGSIGTTYEPYSYSFAGFPGVDNNPNFGVRIMTEFQSTAEYGASANANYFGTANTYGSTGTVTYDIVTFEGDAITNTSLTPPTLSIAGLAAPSGTTVTLTNVQDFTNLILNVTVGSADMPASNLTVFAETAPAPNPGLQVRAFHLPVVNFAASGTNGTWSIVATPTVDDDGIEPVLVTVTDTNGYSTATWFDLQIQSVNKAPTNSLVSLDTTGTNTLVNTPLTLALSVTDDRTPANGQAFIFNEHSSNNTVIQTGSIVVTPNNYSNATVTITPATLTLGVAPITVSVNDNDLLEPRTTTANFDVFVRPNTNVVLIDYFDYDADSPSEPIDQVGGPWTHLTGTLGQMKVNGGAAVVDQFDFTENMQATLIGAPYKTNSGKALYASFIVNVPDSTKMPTDEGGNFFGVFNDGSGTTGLYECEMYFGLGVGPSTYRLGIGSGTNSPAGAFVPTDLSVGVNYTVVTRLVLSNGVSTLWINPLNENSAGVTDSTPILPGPLNISDFELRESGGGGEINVSELKVGTTFDSVCPSPHAIQSGTNVVVTASDPTLPLYSSTALEGPYSQVSISTPYMAPLTNAELFFRFAP